MTDHQWLVPRGFSGKIRKSRSGKGMVRIAARFMTASRSWDPYDVGKNFKRRAGDTMWRLVSSPCVVEQVAPPPWMYSWSIARYVSIMPVSRYWSVEVAGHARRVKSRLAIRRPRDSRIQSMGPPVDISCTTRCRDGSPTSQAG